MDNLYRYAPCNKTTHKTTGEQRAARKFRRPDLKPILVTAGVESDWFLLYNALVSSTNPLKFNVVTYL